jgi:hypothetical protein
MAGALRVDRRQAMAYRVAALGLDRRRDTPPGELAVLDLGVQEYTPGSVRVALAARTTAGLDDDRLCTVWAVRGAPHLHRRADLPALAAALWPVDDADAAARIASNQIREGGAPGIAAFTVTARAFRSAVTSSMPRGEVSTRVSALVPASLTYDCGACGARHIAGTIFQSAGLPGGVFVESRGSGATLAPIADWPGVPDAARGTDALLTTYLRLLGPAGMADAAGYLGTKPGVLRKVWPAGSVPVEVDGRSAWLPADRVDALRAASRPEGTRLLPAMDPLLQARDRDVLVPEKARQKQIWRPLGNPGVLLHDGELVGVWRAKMAGRSRVDLTVTPFETLGAAALRGVEEQAEVVAVARGVPQARVVVA